MASPTTVVVSIVVSRGTHLKWRRHPNRFYGFDLNTIAGGLAGSEVRFVAPLTPRPRGLGASAAIAATGAYGGGSVWQHLGR